MRNEWLLINEHSHGGRNGRKKNMYEDIEFVEIHNYFNLDDAEERKNKDLYFAFGEKFDSYLTIKVGSFEAKYIKNNVVYRFEDISIDELLDLMHDSLIVNEDLVLKAWRST